MLGAINEMSDLDQSDNSILLGNHESEVENQFSSSALDNSFGVGQSNARNYES